MQVIRVNYTSKYALPAPNAARIAEARIAAQAGLRLRRVQTGHVQNYALGIAVGLIAMAVGYFLIAVR